jgi:hypothetical protein
MPPLGPNTAEGYIEVPYPPPPAHAEFVPPRPAGGVWVDGQWSWHGTRWRWEPGGWVMAPPAGTYFAPWAAARRSDGVLLFAPARWRLASGKDTDAPRMLAPARTTASSEPGPT